MQFRWLLIACAIACGSKNTKTQQQQSAPRDCLSPVAYGAVVDDGKDDRRAVQDAIDDAANRNSDVCLPDGRLDISRVPGKISSLITPRGAAITIRGTGPKSMLAMLGQKGDEHHRDWWLIQVTGEGHTLR